MKKIFLTCLILITGISVNCQQTEPVQKQQLTQQEYLQKSRKQKTAAWILLAGGTGLVIISEAIVIGESTAAIVTMFSDNPSPAHMEAAVVMSIIGGVAIVTSIPLFISAGKYKRKAKDMSLNMIFEKTSVVHNTNIGVRYFPALSLNIKLK